MEAWSGRQGHPSGRGGWGWLYSGPASGEVSSDWLIPFDVVRFRLINLFGSVLNIHICSIYVLYRYTIMMLTL
jgi:hypothetical protein